MERRALILVASLVPFVAAPAAPRPAAVMQQASVDCPIDLARVGQMEDVRSDALMHAYQFEERRTRPSLTEARKGCADGPELRRKTAAGFGLDVTHLDATVTRYRHVNCEHPHEPIAELAALEASSGAPSRK